MSLVDHWAKDLLGPNMTESVKATWGDQTFKQNAIPATPFEQFWVDCYLRFGEFSFILVVYSFMIVCYILGGLFCALIDYSRVIFNYKIQPDKYNDSPGYWLCITNIVQNYVLIIVPLIVTAYPLFTFLKFDASIPLPTWSTFLAQFVFFMFSEDFTHYFLHRLLHTPWLYKNIHKVHHTYQAPFGLAASFAHPLEILILGFCTFSGPLVVGPHYFTFFVWIVYRQMDAVLTHSGYDLPWDPLNWLPFYGGAKAHDYHHKVFNCNYSSRFTYLDKLFGTYRDPPELKWKKA